MQEATTHGDNSPITQQIHSGSGDIVRRDKIIYNNQRTIHAKNYIENYHVTQIYKKLDGNHAIIIPDIYNASIVSIHNANGKIIATGSLVTSNCIITTYANIANSDTLTVTFALRSPQTSFEATLIEHNQALNIALLKIESDTPFSIPLIPAQYGEGFVAYGFDTPNGEWIEGEYKGSLANALQQITTQKPIYSGFSGSPIWDIHSGGISGMMNDRDSMIPIAKVLESFAVIDDELKAFQNPYKGLFSFGYEDRANFYGRDEEIAKIVMELESTKLYTIMGASGSGKSSLLFAGVVPHIQSQDNIIEFRPSNQLFDTLANLFVPYLYSDPIEQESHREELTTKLKSGEIKLANLIKRYSDTHELSQCYIIIDQFEELFTLATEQETIERFLDQLLYIISSTQNITLILSIRSDFIAFFSSYPAFNHAIDNHPTMLLAIMDETNLQKAITLPAQKLGVSFQDGLVEKILDEIAHNKAQLPLLEFALYELWQKMHLRQITHQSLEDMGGITHAISHYANSIYHETNLDKESIKRIFLKLVNVGSGTEDTRRVAKLSEFREQDSTTIKALADRRLVVTSTDTVEVVHEALIREWQIYREWINEYREFLEWEKRLESDYEVYRITQKF